MKKHFLWILASLLALAIWACNENSVSSDSEDFPELTMDQRIAYAQAVLKDITGNGAPSGAHYNLNIIGVPKDKTAAMDSDQGHRIFVKLQGKSKIYVAQGDSFVVLDGNATDGNGGRFQMPSPDPDGDGVTAYAIYARALGKPEGSSTMTTCASVDTSGDGIEDTTYCATFGTIFVRSKGKSRFTNVSNELLTAYADLDGDGVLESYSIFDEALLGSYWDYDNKGLKLLQLRFYEVVEDVN